MDYFLYEMSSSQGGKLAGKKIVYRLTYSSSDGNVYNVVEEETMEKNAHNYLSCNYFLKQKKDTFKCVHFPDNYFLVQGSPEHICYDECEAAGDGMLIDSSGQYCITVD